MCSTTSQGIAPCSLGRLVPHLPIPFLVLSPFHLLLLPSQFDFLPSPLQLFGFQSLSFAPSSFELLPLSPLPLLSITLETLKLQPYAFSPLHLHPLPFPLYPFLLFSFTFAFLPLLFSPLTFTIPLPSSLRSLLLSLELYLPFLLLLSQPSSTHAFLVPFSTALFLCLGHKALFIKLATPFTIPLSILLCQHALTVHGVDDLLCTVDFCRQELAPKRTRDS